MNLQHSTNFELAQNLHSKIKNHVINHLNNGYMDGNWYMWVWIVDT
jgi:hypothetical protein